MSSANSQPYRTRVDAFSFYGGQFQSSRTPLENAVAQVTGYALSDESLQQRKRKVDSILDSHPMPTVRNTESRLKYMKRRPPKSNDEENGENESDEDEDSKLRNILGNSMAAASLRLKYLKEKRARELTNPTDQVNGGKNNLRHYNSARDFLENHSKINTRIRQARITMLLNQYKKTIMKWLKIRKCNRCSYYYNYISSVGQWQCRYCGFTAQKLIFF